MKPIYSKALAVIALCCLGIIVYSNTFHGSFHFDDEPSIVNNYAIKHIQNLRSIWNFYPTRFITYLSIAFNYQLGGLKVFGYHLFNLLVHLGSAMLIWWLTILTFHTPLIKKEAISAYAKPIAFFTSAIFLLHPIQTQPVNYIIQRATLLATFFYIASLSLYVKARLKQKERPSSHIWKVYYSGSLLMAVISMLSKEIAITLPLAVFLYEFCFLRIKKDFRWKYFTPFFIIMLIMSMAILFTKALDFKRLGGAVEDGSSLSVLPYFLTQAKVKVTYLRLLFIPLNQNLDYDYPIAKSIFEIPVIFSFLVLFFILLAGIRLFHKHKLISFGIFWFFITLLPESGIIPIKDIIFEHRLYLPMAGFSLFLVSTVYYLFGAKTLKPMVAILLIIIACYSVLTYRRNSIWKDEFTLWNDVIRKSPKKVRPYNNRGLAYIKQGDPSQAFSDFNRAIQIDPHLALAYYNRGLAYQKQGNLNQAISDYNRAIQINPNYVQAYNNRTVVYFLNREYDKSWEDVHKVEKLGGKVHPEFLEELKKASGRER